MKICVMFQRHNVNIVPCINILCGGWTDAWRQINRFSKNFHEYCDGESRCTRFRPTNVTLLLLSVEFIYCQLL